MASLLSLILAVPSLVASAAPGAAAAASSGAGAAAAAAGQGETGWMIWTFGLFGLALLIVVLEVFLPSGGILGAVAFISAMAGVVFAFRGGGELAGLAALGVVMLSTPTIVWVLVKVFPSTPIGSRIILSDNLSEEELAQRERDRAAQASALTGLIGAHGMAVTVLRPGGTVRIDGEDIEAFAETGMIEPETEVVVARVVGRQIRVRPVTGSASSARPRTTESGATAAAADEFASQSDTTPPRE